MTILTSDQFVRSYPVWQDIQPLSAEAVFSQEDGLTVYQVFLRYQGALKLDYVSLDRNAVCDHTDTAVAWLLWRERLQGQGGRYAWYDELIAMDDGSFAGQVLPRCWRTEL